MAAPFSAATRLTFEDLLAIIPGGVRPCGSGYRFHCPGPRHHRGDHRESAKVSVGHTKPVVFYCRVGCTQEEVRDALGITSWSQISGYPENGRLQVVNGSRREPDYIHVYRDADGRAVLRKLRYGRGKDKWCVWQHPSGDTWENCKDCGHPKVPYRLNDCIAALAGGAHLVAVEGELDADALWDLGIPATCNPDGGGTGKWRAVARPVAEHFRDAEVVIIRDRDLEKDGFPGHQHAAEGAAVFRAVGCTVRIVEPAAGNDAWDHFELHNKTFAELVPVDEDEEPAAKLSVIRGPGADLTRLPPDFWEANQIMEHLRQASLARRVGPDAVLANIFTLEAALMPHTVCLPAFIGGQMALSFAAAVVGRPGTKKSAANRVGTELLPPYLLRYVPSVAEPADLLVNLPLGSGEGMAEIFYGMVMEKNSDGKPESVRAIVRHNAHFYADEGELLVELGFRKGSTVNPVLRTIVTQGTIGNTNANVANRRAVHGDQYSVGVSLSIQAAKAGPLLNEVSGGTSQRFLWLRSGNPTAPRVVPDWPGRLPWWGPGEWAGRLAPLKAESPNGSERYEIPVCAAVANELDEYSWLVETEQLVLSDDQAHEMLLRLKMAAFLSALQRRIEVDEAEWQMAGVVSEVCAANKALARQQLHAEDADRERASTDRKVRQELTVHAAKENSARISAMRSAARVVWNRSCKPKHGDAGCTDTCLLNAVAGEHKRQFGRRTLLEEAERAGYISRKEKRWFPGKTDPR